MRRRKLIRLSGGIALGGLAGCTGGGDGGDTPTETVQPTDDETPTATQSMEEMSDDELMEMADPPDEIVITDFPIPGINKLYYAMEKGLFEKRGLNVNLTSNPIFGGSRNLAALLADNAHIATGVSMMAPINLARSQNTFTPLLYPNERANFDNHDLGGVWMILNPEFQSISDLKGETIASHTGTTGVVPLTGRYHVDQAGLDPFNDVEFTQVPLPQIGGAVARGEVAAGIWFEPNILQARREGVNIRRSEPAYEWLEPGVIAGHFLAPGFADNYEATTRLLQRTYQEMEEHLDDEGTRKEIFDIGSERLDIRRDIFDIMWERGYFPRPILNWSDGNPQRSFGKFQDLQLEYTTRDISGKVDTSNLILPWNG